MGGTPLQILIMEDIWLYTESGAKVVKIAMPANLWQKPLVVLWGLRVFLWNDPRGRYLETFAWHAPDRQMDGT